MLDWVSDPEWNWEDLPKVVDLLWARDGEHWEHWEQHYYPVSFVNPAAVVINYLAADMGLPPQCCIIPCNSAISKQQQLTC
ncbi:UNVERIFIED_CONTAM: hypothetical protein FKN15_016103 [Acipenser sinensis]